MARTLSTAVKDAAKGDPVRPFLLVELVLDIETSRICSLDRDISWSGNTYVGVGNLGRISVIEESSELQASGISAELTGIPNDYLTIALQQKYQGRTFRIYLGFLDTNFAIIIDPVLMFEGLIDQMNGALGETSSLTLTAENKLIRWESSNVKRYTHAEQDTRFAGDKGLEFVNEVVNKDIIWGS